MNNIHFRAYSRKKLKTNYLMNECLIKMPSSEYGPILINSKIAIANDNSATIEILSSNEEKAIKEIMNWIRTGSTSFSAIPEYKNIEILTNNDKFILENSEIISANFPEIEFKSETEYESEGNFVIDIHYKKNNPVINKELYTYLQIRFNRNNISKYRIYFKEWIQNVNDIQLYYYEKEMKHLI